MKKMGFIAVSVLVLSIFIAGCASVPQLGEGNYEYFVEDVMVMSRGVEIPVTVSYPKGEEGDKFPLIVMVHGFGANRHENGGYTLISNQLASAGFATVRMDFSGCGDSIESFMENNLTNMLEDIEVSRLYAVENYPMIDSGRTGILGYSLGGRLATHSVALNPGIYKSLGAIAPSANDGAELFGRATGYMMTIAEKNGYFLFETPWGANLALGIKFFEDITVSIPTELIKDYPGAVFVVVGEKDPMVPAEMGLTLVESAENASYKGSHLIIGADHGFGIYTGEEHLTRELSDQLVDFFLTTINY